MSKSARRALQVDLVVPERKIIENGLQTLIHFEGDGAAGKDGSIT